MTSETKQDIDIEAAKKRSLQAAQMGRRNFLKGTSLVLPVAMTITPGTAQALASITCGQKALDSPMTAANLVSSEDEFLRYQVTVYDQMVEETINNVVTMVPNNEPTYFRDTVTNEWRNVTGAVEGPAGADDNADPKPDDIGTTTYTRFAIVHIDATDGSPVAVGSGSAPSNAIITSAAGLCMASLMGQA